MSKGKIITDIILILATIFGIIFYIRDKNINNQKISFKKIGISCAGVLAIIIVISTIPESFSDFTDSSDAFY